MSAQISLILDDSLKPQDDLLFAFDVIVDRWSRYGYALGKVAWKDEIKKFLIEVNDKVYFSSADHLSYAFRVRSPEGAIYEWKDDDWETWAWECILREIKRKNAEDIILVVSRHFWWVYLQKDRYKNIVDICRLALNILK